MFGSLNEARTMLRQRLTATPFAAQSGDIVPLVRQAAALSKAEGEAPANGTRCGGRPFVSSSFDWPRTKDGRPLALLLQLACADIWRACPALDLRLPSSGRLLAFYDLEGQPFGDRIDREFRSWRLIHDSCASAAEVDWPDDLQAAHRIEPAPLAISARYTLPDDGNHNLLPLFEAGDGGVDLDVFYGRRRAWRDLRDAFLGALPARIHQVGGWANPLQSGTLEELVCLAEANLDETADWRSPQHAAALAKRSEQHFVLEIDSTDTWDIIGGGKAYYYMNEAALQAGEWDRATLQAQR